MSLAEMNSRNREVFRLIVETYLETGEPVGSRTISRAGISAKEEGKGLDVSAATIRNCMADLEDAGLLSSPHTSSGRIPTDMGLRFFVDGLMQMGNLTKSERAAIQAQCQTEGRRANDILGEATKALSGLSQCASLVMVPQQELAVRHIEFVPLSRGRALVVLVSEDGNVENRLIETDPNLPASSLIQAGNFLASRLLGKTLQAAKREIEQELETQQLQLDTLTADMVKKGLAVWSGSGDDARLLVTGAAHLLTGAEDTEKLEKIRLIFNDLDRKKDLVNMLDLARRGPGIRLFIGAENNLFSLSGSSLILAPYMKGENRVVGVLGVIGPTRLNYARIIPMVDYTAQVVSRLL